MFNSVFRVLILIIGILYIANVVLFSGCMPRNTDHVTANDELSQALVDSIDPNILRYRGNREEYDGVKEYIFSIASENADGVGDELKVIYNETNKILQDDNFSSQSIRIMVVTEGVHGESCIVVIMSNFFNLTPKPTTDYISFIQAGTINGQMTMYNPDCEYEINEASYWDYYSDIDAIRLFDKIIYLNDDAA